MKKPNTVIRSIVHQIKKRNQERFETQSKSSYTQLLLTASAIETMFYLPNRFRQVVLLNTQTVAFSSTENALLSLMSIMFNLQNNNELQFKLRQFVTCYRLFFTSTLPYEAFGLASRYQIFQSLNNTELIHFKNYLINGFISGMLTQYLVNPLFKLNIMNHNYKLSDSTTIFQCYRKAFQDKQMTKTEFLFKTPISVIFRGGILGLIQMGLFKNILDSMEQPLSLLGVEIKSSKTPNELSREFMTSIEDDNEVLTKLTLAGYFERKYENNKVSGINSYKSIMISSIITAIAISLVLTPIDILVFNQFQTRLLGPKSLQNISLRQIAKELRPTKGRHIVLTMLFASSLVRNFFITSSFYCGDNYLKTLILTE